MGKAKAKAKPANTVNKVGNCGGVRKGLKLKKSGEGGALTLARNSRRLYRRSSDEAAERAIKLKLGMFPAEQLRNNVDDQKKSLFENVKAEQARVKQAKKHMTLGFWQGLISSHHLVGNVCHDMVGPLEEEVVSKTLDNCIRQAHIANPAQKTSLPLVRHLSFMQRPNATEFFGLCKASFESPSMSKPMSKVLCEALLQMIGRTRCDQAYPVYWRHLQAHFDQLLCQLWCKAQADEVTRPGFLRARRSELQMFIDMKVATDVEQALADGNDPDPAHITLLGKQSLIGSELFTAEAMKQESALFVQDCKSRLFELEQLDFDIEELATFRTLMMAQADGLDDAIWKQFDARELALDFLNGEVKGQSSSPNCDWSGRLEARAKTIGVSNGQIQRTAWEAHLFGADQAIPNIPTALELPESMIYDMKNGRDHINKVIGTGWQSTHRMKQTVRQHSEQWLKMDPSAWMDIYFLEEVFEGKMAEKMESCMMALLPSVGERRSIQKAVVAARLLATGDVATAQTKALMDKLNAAVNILVDISEARGPTCKQLMKMAEFTQRVVKKAEAFCHTYAEDFDAAKKLVSRRTLYGQEGINHVFARCTLVSGVQDAADLKMFKMFAWMLTESQHAEYLTWEQQAVKGARERHSASKAKALKDISDTIVAEKKKRGSAPPATQLVTAPPLALKKLDTQLAKKAKYQEVLEENQEDLFTDTGLISFFGTKAL